MKPDPRQIGLFQEPAQRPRARAKAIRKGAAPHHCHARMCSRPVGPKYLMCLTHWKRLPQVIRAAVWRHYREGQEIDKNPSVEWLEAAAAAIGFTAKDEGRQMTEAETRALAKILALPSAFEELDDPFAGEP